MRMLCLPLPVAFERFQVVAGQRGKVLQGFRFVECREFPLGGLACDSRPSRFLSISACPVKTAAALACDPARTE